MRNTTFNQISLCADIILSIVSIFGGSIVAAVVNIILACALLTASVVPYYYESFPAQLFDRASNQFMVLANSLLVFTYVQALLSLLLGFDSIVVDTLPWVSLVLFIAGLFLIFVSRNLSGEKDTEPPVAQEDSRNIAIGGAKDLVVLY